MIEERTKDFCVRYNITEDQFYGKVKIEGDLCLGSLTSIPKGFNPTVIKHRHVWTYHYETGVAMKTIRKCSCGKVQRLVMGGTWEDYYG